MVYSELKVYSLLVALFYVPLFFSLPLGDESTGRIRDKSVGMIAEVNIYCVEYSKAKILKQLEESLTKQGNISALIGKTLPQVLFRTGKFVHILSTLQTNKVLANPSHGME